MAFRVAAGGGEGVVADVDGGKLATWEFGGEINRNTAAARANVKDRNRLVPHPIVTLKSRLYFANYFQCLFLSLRARYQYIGIGI